MIELKNATKYFKTNSGRKYILDDVTMNIPPKINIGIMGRNGAGKSTLLRMLGGIDFPTSGEIISDENFSWPMGFSGGFQGSMTGRQNCKFVCRIYNKTDDEMREIIDYIYSFSELGEYFDMPIKKYSSGMRSRLNFGLSLAFDFDYMLIDETLSAGDMYFKEKAQKALEEKMEACNYLLVSHNMQVLEQMCDAGILVDNGKLIYFGKISDAIEAYKAINR